MSEHTEHDAKADRLQDLISEKLFDAVCDARLVRSDHRRFDVEDSDPEMYPPDEYPVVYLDAEGRRYSVEVEVTVSPLPSVEAEREQDREFRRELAVELAPHHLRARADELDGSHRQAGRTGS